MYYIGAIIVCALSVFVFLIGLNTNIFNGPAYLLLFKDKLTNRPNTLSTLEANMASSFWCTERMDGSKLCYFRNLYYMPHLQNHFIFLLNEFSTLNGVKSAQDLKKIGLSTIKNHSGLYLQLIVIKSHEYLLQHQFEFLNEDILIMKRFKPDNIMHVIHDDLIPLFFTFKEICKDDIHLCASTYKLFFFDENEIGPYYELYKHFSHKTPTFILNQTSPIVLRKGVFGLSYDSVWFHYGFKEPQGPSLNSKFNGLQLKQFTEFIKQQYHIKDIVEPLKSQKTIKVVFMSRKLNRKILNEVSVEAHINKICQQHYQRPVEVLNMDLSTDSLTSLVSSLDKANLLIGMHGSGMILGIFLPQGSNIIEIFPFGIHPEHVSPVKALYSLPSMLYTYDSWVNINESNSVTHPDYPPLHGGLLHLPISTQETIIKKKSVPPVECCHNPLYLFRMFQDTVVDDSFYSLLKSSLVKQSNIDIKQKFSESVQKHIYDTWYFPPPVFNLSCKCIKNNLMLSWDFPYFLPSVVTFSVATSTGISAFTEYTNFSTVTVKCYSDDSGSRTPVAVWVKTLEGHQESIDSYTKCV